MVDSGISWFACNMLQENRKMVVGNVSLASSRCFRSNLFKHLRSL